MPSASAQLLVSVDGGAPASGGQTTANDAAAIALSAVSKVGWGNPPTRWQIASFPSGFACPAGWSTATTTIGGQSVAVYQYTGNSDPPAFDLPGGGWWGKLLFRLVVLGGTTSTLVDELCGVEVRSPNGVRDIAFLEAGQFDAARRAVGPLQANLRLLEDALAAGGATSDLTLTAVKTANYTAAIGELVRVDATAGDITIEAPTAVGHADERWGVLRVEPTLPVSHTVTIDAADSINDEGTRPLALARSCCILRSDGATWRVESEFLDVTVSDATPAGVSTSGSAGTSTALARGDHVHALTYAVVQSAIGGASSALGLNAQRLTGVADPVNVQDAATKAWVLANAGGAPSRIVALDANDIAEWKLDDAAEPWADGVGSLDLTGYGGLASYAPVVSVGGSIHGDRCVFCDWNADSGLRSDTTTVGEVAAGTVHGWALLTAEQGTIFAKDEGSSIYLRTASNGPAASYELVAKIGDSGDVSVAPTRYRALVHSGGWTHFAMTWSGGTAYVYVNGVKLPTALSYTSITWGAGRWRLGKCDGLGSLSGLMSSWRVCNVARSAAYIDEVYRRAVGRWP